MSTVQASNERATRAVVDGLVDMKLEVVALPVTDVDRAKRFYVDLGWRVDADFTTGQDFRVVQLTPPGSQCSIQFGKGVTAGAPGSVQGLFLVVDDVEAARAELVRHGVEKGVHVLLRHEGQSLRRDIDAEGTSGK